MAQTGNPDNPRIKRKYYLWTYGHYPFLLGGPGVQRPDGRVETDNYGRGNTFRPEYAFTLSEGRQFHNELNRLEREKEKALEDVHELYAHKLLKLMTRDHILAAQVKPEERKPHADCS